MSSLSDSAFCTYRFSVPGADDGLTIAAVVISITAPNDRTVQIKDLQIYECGGKYLCFGVSIYCLVYSNLVLPFIGYVDRIQLQGVSP